MMQTKQNMKIIVLLLVANIIIVSLIQPVPKIIINNEDDGNIWVDLSIIHLRDGRILKIVEKKNDVLTRNFWAIYVGHLDSRQAYFDRENKMPTYLTSIDGTTTYSISYMTRQARIRVGTGTSTPTKNDYCLQNPVAGNSVQGLSISYSGNNAVVTASTTITFSTSYSISECDVEVYDGSNYYMIARDVFTSINVAAGDTLMITYTFNMVQG